MKKRMDAATASKPKKHLNNEMAGTIEKPFDYITDTHEPVDQDFEFIQAADRKKRRGYTVYLDDTGHEIARYRARRW